MPDSTPSSTTLRLMNTSTLRTRLKRIEGQVRGVERMAENDQFCDDISLKSALRPAHSRP